MPEENGSTMLKRLFGIYPLKGEVDEEKSQDGFVKNKKCPTPAKVFTNHVKLKKYDLEKEQIECTDEETRGVFFEFFPSDTEARPINILEDISQKIMIALQSLPPSDPPWILQIYLQDEPVETFIDQVEDYSKEDSGHKNAWLNVLREHLNLISSRDGIFKDKYTEMNWHAKFRRTRAVLYRKPGKKFTPDDLNSVANRFVASLRESGVKVKRLSSEDIYTWLLPWYSGKGVEGYEYVKKWPYPVEDEKSGDLPADFDIGEMCLAGARIKLEEEMQCWRVGKRLQKFISLHPIRQNPRVGLWTTETAEGASPFDKLPSGSILAFNIVIEAHDKNQTRIERIKEKSIGNSQESLSTSSECEQALKLMVEGNRLVRWFSGIYVAADNKKELDIKTNVAAAAAGSASFEVFDTDDDPYAQDVYLRSLPLNFDPDHDKKTGKRARAAWDSHAARMLPFYGGGTGTGNPGVVMWSRVGQPMTFDPLNKDDRSKNAHALVLGPTGSGKTATLNYMLLHTMAVHKPKLFLVTALPTFGLLGAYFKSNGLSVNHIHFQPDQDISIPPFSEITKLEEDVSIAKDRDIMGEAEILARLMITGGETKEEEALRRSEKALIQKAIANTASRVYEEKADQRWVEYDGAGEIKEIHLPQALTEDVVFTFREMAKSQDYTENEKNSLRTMATSMDKFTHGLDGHFFNREGKAWPEADVTIVEIGILAKKGYEDKLAIAR